jgi:methylmalonyl-CoA mutase
VQAQHAVTSAAMMAARDPWVNMLRTTLACFAAGVGGADAVTVLPFTQARGLPDRFARRVGRNTQLILLEESHLAKVADPAAGAGGIEDLTDKLCVAAWAQFQEIEQAGGIFAALETGFIQGKVATVRAERQAAIARRKDALTGVSEYPNLKEASVEVLDIAPVALPGGGPAVVSAAPLPAIRLAAPFETLRDASDRMLVSSGARPNVFLACLGTAADFTARASFAANLFEAGGIEAVLSPPEMTDLAAAFLASGAKLACIASSDAVYAREAAETAQALKEAGATHIYLAGRPGELEAVLRAAGVQSFIYAGGDVLATLTAAHDILTQGG